MTSPKVSVIIPAYNYGQYIGEGINSLQLQSLADYECIVVDDGSTDDTRQIVEELAENDRRIKYVSQQNSGQPTARNTGIKLAAGRYLQFMDADDLLEPNKLKIQVSFLEQHPQVSVVYGNVFYFRDADREDLFINRWGDRDEQWMPGVEGEGDRVVRAYVSGNIFELGCGMFRTEAVAEVGVFDSGLQGVEDYDFCFRLALKGKSFAHLKTPGSATLMRHHAGSFSKSLVLMYRQELTMRRAMRTELKLLPSDISLLNEHRFETRLDQLLKLLIDLRRKKQLLSRQQKLLAWIWSVASPRQKLYFFPRWVKAELTTTFS